MNQMIKVILGPIIGGVIGYFVGSFLQRQGGTCPLTCTPWGAMITGAAIGLLFVLQK